MFTFLAPAFFLSAFFLATAAVLVAEAVQFFA
jgi:hypothetical protein